MHVEKSRLYRSPNHLNNSEKIVSHAGEALSILFGRKLIERSNMCYSLDQLGMSHAQWEIRITGGEDVPGATHKIEGTQHEHSPSSRHLVWVRGLPVGSNRRRYHTGEAISIVLHVLTVVVRF